jgi:DNA-binding CsgD family transcriptional regulator
MLRGDDTFDECISLARVGLRDLLNFEHQPTIDGFHEVLHRIVETYGLRNAVYYSPTLQGFARTNPFIVLTYQPEWINHYVKSNYETVDPVVSTGVRSLLPVDWARLDRSNPKAARMFNESREAGVGAQGLTIPIRGVENGVWGLFSVTSNEQDREWARRRPEIVADLVLIGNFLHQKAFEFHNTGETIDLNAITRREAEALAWTSEGKSVADIAVLMRISSETVKAHLDSARYKLGALNRVHAVAKAIRHGIIR